MSKNLKESNTLVDAKKDNKGLNRRKVIGSLAVIGGVSALPTSWVKPVVNSVMLPAHAQTSTDTENVSPSVEVPFFSPAASVLSVPAFADTAPAFINTDFQGLEGASGFSTTYEVFNVPATGLIQLSNFEVSNSDDNVIFTGPLTINLLLADTFVTGPLQDSNGVPFSIVVENLSANALGFTINLL